MNIQNVHFQKAEYENALIQLNEGLDVFAAVMTMSRLEKSNVFSFVANVFSFVVLLIFVICAGSLHTTTSLPCCIGNFDVDLESLLVVLQRSLVLTLAVVNNPDVGVGRRHVRVMRSEHTCSDL